MYAPILPPSDANLLGKIAHRARDGPVRDDCATMSDAKSPNGRQDDSIPEGGILAALPRARPQRASPRRAAARADKPTATIKPADTRTTKKPAATKKRTAKPIAKPAEPRAPKQGYEPEEELELGGTVNPPSGAELVESVADIVGELANSGLAAGGRLLKDAFSLLRRP
jgi:hypothetical protein